MLMPFFLFIQPISVLSMKVCNIHEFPVSPVRQHHRLQSIFGKWFQLSFFFITYDLLHLFVSRPLRCLIMLLSLSGEKMLSFEFHRSFTNDRTFNDPISIFVTYHTFDHQHCCPNASSKIYLSHDTIPTYRFE